MDQCSVRVKMENQTSRRKVLFKKKKKVAKQCKRRAKLANQTKGYTSIRFLS